MIFFRNLLLALLLGVSIPSLAAPLLPGYQASPEATSVSGLSSGGYMASQFHVAYSADLIGAGIVAAGPYYCAGSGAPEGAAASAVHPYLSVASTTCMNPCQWAFWPFVSWCEAFYLPDGAELADKAEAFATADLIDPLSSLVDDRIYLFSGGLDTTVVTGVVDQAKAFYVAAGVPEQAIQYDTMPEADHAFISDNSDSDCDRHAPPFINNCDGYDQARQLLSHIYGGLNDNASALTGTMVAFDQSEFVPARQLAISGLADTAFVYVPEDCQNEACRIHIAFHGCRQSAAEFATNKVFFREQAGYNEVADSNQIIVLYPQIRSGAVQTYSPFNPKGCWDFWGYTGSDFYHQQSIQMSAVRAMIERLQK
ncbi:MAG: poly(3-hydroxybutyrate) depolymerase [Motiliproteus sp.]